jgi:predicted nuclease of predicted toxin-antitoxin system
MRILIDECLDWRLCRAVAEHQCTTVQEAGWEGLTNGQLLEQAEALFDVFLTGDRNLTFQQNLSSRKIAVIVLEARSTRLADTLQLIPQVLITLRTIQPGQVVRIRQ